jgi:hypothetical protein
VEASEIEEVVCGEMTTTNEKLLTCGYFELNLEIEITNIFVSIKNEGF